MRIIRQNNHETCQQACIAMLAGVELEDVVALVGDRALGTDERRKAFDHYGIRYPEGEAGKVISVVETPLIKMMREHRTLLCSVADWKDPNWGHAVVIYDRHIYDPWRGIDPEWPWTRHVWKAMPVEGPAAQVIACTCQQADKELCLNKNRCAATEAFLAATSTRNSRNG